MGWETTDAAKLRIAQLHSDGQLVSEESVERLTALEASLFERAMGERWKDFHHAAVSKLSLSCVCVMMRACYSI